jgi:hypothetical protein
MAETDAMVTTSIHGGSFQRTSSAKAEIASPTSKTV